MTSVADAPVPPNEAARVEALRRYRILDTAPEVEFDELTQLAARLCDVPVALITLIDEDRMWVKSAYGMKIRELTRDVALARFHRDGSGVDLVITDVVMPKMSGPDRIQKRAAIRSSLNVFYMSGYPAHAVNSQRLVATGFSFPPKRFTPEILAQKARKILDSGA